MNRVTKNKKQNEINDVLKNIQILDEKINNERKIRIIKILIVILIVFSLFKVFIGEINISIPNIFYQHKNRLYSVEINDKSVSVGVEENKTIINIPHILNYSIFSSHLYAGELDRKQLVYKLGEKIYLNINTFECYDIASNNRISCAVNDRNSKLVQKSDVKYHLLIRKTSKGEKIFYDEIFTNDISKYFTENGAYNIFITAKYKNVKSSIYFIITIK